MPPAGRPRTFDREIALKKAMYLFWEKGYEGTTMTDIIQSIGVKAPGVYAAFGNKDAIFKEAVALYRAQIENGPLKVLIEIESIQDAVESALASTIDQYACRENPTSCLVMTGAINTAPEHSEHANTLREIREAYKNVWLQRFIRAKKDNQLVDVASPDDLAEYVITFIHGLALRAKDVSKKSELQASVDLMLVGLKSLIRL